MSGEKRHIRVEEARAVMARMEEDRVWDTVQARDLDPTLIEYVAQKIERGWEPKEIAKSLGMTGVGSREWKKIQAYFRQGFRADAEAYLYRQTLRFYKTIDDVKEILEDAIQNGTPHVLVNPKDGSHEIIRVKGATKELGSFLESYSKSIALPVKLWKEYGAIGEKKEGTGQGITIVVENSIPMPSMKEIEDHKKEVQARISAIEVKPEKVLDAED